MAIKYNLVNILSSHSKGGNGQLIRMNLHMTGGKQLLRLQNDNIRRTFNDFCVSLHRSSHLDFIWNWNRNDLLLLNMYAWNDILITKSLLS